MQIDHAVSAVVLAGGLSRRLGQDKRNLRLWGDAGPTLLEHVVGLLGRVSADVVAVLNDPEQWSQLPARCAPDIYADGGALGGMYSGLKAAQCDYALIVACDMPFLNLDLLNAMLARRRDYDVLVPRSLETGMTRNALNVESLHAVYSKACLEPMRLSLENGRRQITTFFPHVRVAYIEPEETQHYDPTGRSFVNINTPDQITETYQRLQGDR